MEAKLAQFSTLSQKDKGPAYISLIPQILAQPPETIAKDLHTLVDTVVNQDAGGLVVGRQVLSELVKVLGEGAIKDAELRKRVVEDTLATVQPRIVSYEEQASPVPPIDHLVLMSGSGEFPAIPASRPARGRGGLERGCACLDGYLSRLWPTVRLDRTSIKL